ncbi:MAG: L-serine dehydratase [Burkholderiales bacterium]
MEVSVFDLFKIGIGPSSSHTVGPMRAASMFVNRLHAKGELNTVARVRAELYGSLGATGKGHGTDKGVMLGLMGEGPDTVDPDSIERKLAEVRDSGKLLLRAEKAVLFSPRQDILFYRQALPDHPNGLKLIAFDDKGAVIRESIYLSVGGGFVTTVGDDKSQPLTQTPRAPHAIRSGTGLLDLCRSHQKSIATLMLENELTWRPEAQVREGVLRIWRVMQDTVQRGCQTGGNLPGPIGVKRRAYDLHKKLTSAPLSDKDPTHDSMAWLNLYALATNEENAGGGRVVTAPTNGAAGIIPAVMHYYARFIDGANDQGIIDFLLTAGAIGALYKRNASISGAEVGCQGEVGVACSMAAAGLCAVMGGTPEQVENAAEIGMEHNLGLTCDPVGGMVQIPCIERNAMGAVKAVNAARMALLGDGTHYVSLDSVIKTMMQTGADMKTKYKETSRGGLAVNIIEC